MLSLTTAVIPIVRPNRGRGRLLRKRPLYSFKSDRKVWAWDQINRGRLGDGTNTDRHTPFQVSGLTGVVAITAEGHSLAWK